jgi:hypothetical protein
VYLSSPASPICLDAFGAASTVLTWLQLEASHPFEP